MRLLVGGGGGVRLMGSLGGECLTRGLPSGGLACLLFSTSHDETNELVGWSGEGRLRYEEMEENPTNPKKILDNATEFYLRGGTVENATEFSRTFLATSFKPHNSDQHRHVTISTTIFPKPWTFYTVKKRNNEKKL
jgi:hypothetical protein